MKNFIEIVRKHNKTIVLFIFITIGILGSLFLFELKYDYLPRSYLPYVATPLLIMLYLLCLFATYMIVLFVFYNNNKLIKSNGKYNCREGTYKYIINVFVIISLLFVYMGTGECTYQYFNVFFSGNDNDRINNNHTQLSEYNLVFTSNSTESYEVYIPLRYPIVSEDYSIDHFHMVEHINNSECYYPDNKIYDLFSNRNIVNPDNVSIIEIVNISNELFSSAMIFSHTKYNDWAAKIIGKGNFTVSFHCLSYYNLYDLTMRYNNDSNVDSPVQTLFSNSSNNVSLSITFTTRMWSDENNSFTTSDYLRFYLPDNKIYEIREKKIHYGWNELSNQWGDD